MKNKISNFVLKFLHRITKLHKGTNEGGIPIRYMRARKFRKRYKAIIISIQLLMIWYFVAFTALHLNSFTNAAFNDVEDLQASIHVKWPIDLWDNSSLDFEHMERGGSCERPYVYTKVKNVGEDMEFSSWKWELYQISGMNGGSPIIIGEALASGLINPILAGEIGIIEAFPENLVNGKYRFIITPPDRPGKDTKWSEEINITGCPGAGTLNISDPKSEEKPNQDEKSNEENQSVTDEKGTTENPPAEKQKEPENTSNDQKEEQKEENEEINNEDEQDGGPDSSEDKESENKEGDNGE